MSTYQKFDNEEEIKIDVVQGENAPINIILRNPSNEDIKYKLDLLQTVNGKDLRSEVDVYFLLLDHKPTKVIRG